MSEQTESPVSYDYDPEAAGHADDFANRINENAPYIGHFNKVEAVVSSEKGTQGVYFEFEAGDGGGKTNFTLWTKKGDGSILGVGYNKLNAIQLIMGVKGMHGVPGKVQRYNADTGEREEVDGTVFLELLEKPIGLIMQKELYTGNDGVHRERMNPLMAFDPKTKLSASEIKERKVKPEKYEKAVKGLKTIDKRVQKASEPAQPAIGAAAGEF